MLASQQNRSVADSHNFVHCALICLYTCTTKGDLLLQKAGHPEKLEKLIYSVENTGTVKHFSLSWLVVTNERTDFH